jgi:hypothetical protein
MLTQVARAGRLAVAAALALCIIPVSSCDKVPLTAPSGTVITLLPPSTDAAPLRLALNSELEIIATAIEQGTTAAAPPANGTTPPTTPASTPGAGTPVHNGTLITFTTTIGRIEPAEARTNNGQVRVRFLSGNASGIGTITAFSGGASGQLVGIRVGGAAAERVVISASPQTIPPQGGTSEITARVEDINGAGLPGLPVSFTADTGQLSAAISNTDQNGVARTTLTATRETIVTANVAGKTATVTVRISPRTGITISGPTTPVAAGVPVPFAVGVGATANIRDVTVDFGDGFRVSLGPITGSITVPHTYNEPETYRVSATATEASGFTETVSTFVSVLPQQPPGVTLTISDTTPAFNQEVIITAQVSGATSPILRYEWQFGSGANQPNTSTTGNRVTVSWMGPTAGTRTIVVRVIQAVGPFGEGFGTVNVTATGGGGSVVGGR